jgi:hypothetical protein
LTTTIQVPRRHKQAPLAVGATANGGISALGDTGQARNRELVLADVRRLLGDACPGDPGDVDALLRLDAPGRADAVARLGGPFAHFVEFTTPEEASQQLGRVIVGAPVVGDDERYDLELSVTLFGGAKPEEHVMRAGAATGPQIVDLPIAFDGQVRPMRWEAEAVITWRGGTIRTQHRSKPMFSTITAWRSIVYDREKDPISPDQVVDAQGRPDQALDWDSRVQTSEGLTSLTQPHALLFYREYADELKAGAKLAGYLATTAASPDEREAVLLFRATGPLEIMLNGQKVEVQPGDGDRSGLHPLLWDDQGKAPLHLRAGSNTLLIHSQPGKTKPPWLFAATLLTPDGELMTDVLFE